jgi:hypothetical protein
MSALIKYLRHPRFIILLILSFLVFVGVKFSDLSRPHKPKCLWGVVLDESPSQTEKQSITKIDLDPVIPGLPTFSFLATEKHFPEAHPVHSSAPFLSLNPLPPRAPPASAHPV